MKSPLEGVIVPLMITSFITLLGWIAPFFSKQIIRNFHFTGCRKIVFKFSGPVQIGLERKFDDGTILTHLGLL
jgi:hypothetical protein